MDLDFATFKELQQAIHILAFIIRGVQTTLKFTLPGTKLLGGVGGCDTPPKVRLAGQGLFLHGKMPTNCSRCDEQKYETGFEKKCH